VLPAEADSLFTLSLCSKSVPEGTRQGFVTGWPKPSGVDVNAVEFSKTRPS